MILKYFVKSSEIFGSAQESSGIFGKLRKQFKSNFQMFYDFFKFSENLEKSWEIFGKLPDVIGNIRNGSQECKSFKAGF